MEELKSVAVLGRGAKGTGRHTRKGGFLINRWRIPEIVVPNLEDFKVLA